MFDSCRRWRTQLSRLADGALPPQKACALQQHLSRCADCRAAHDADVALTSAVSMHVGSMDVSTDDGFDDRVVAALREPEVSRPTTPSGRSPLHVLQANLKAVRLSYLAQLTGGGLLAATVVGLCFLPTIRPSGAIGAPNSRVSNGIPLAAPSNDPPVPLESLLRNPTPRAALLWSAPFVPRPEQTAPASAPKRKPQIDDQRGSLPNGVQLS